MTRRHLSVSLAAAALAAAAGCSSPEPPRQTPAPAAPKGPTVMNERFGTMPDGTAVDIFTLKNASGMELRAI